MAIRLLPWADRTGALVVLTEAGNALTRLPTPVHPRDYISWALDQTRMFRGYFHPEVVAELIATPRYDAIQQIGAASFATGAPPPLVLLINAEIEDRRRHLGEAADKLRAELAAWDSCPGRILVPDTNLYLQHRDKFDEIQWGRVGGEAANAQVTLVVPMIVIRELDRLKRSQNTRWRAAYSLSKIESLYGEKPVGSRCIPIDSTGAHVSLKVLVSDLGHSSLARPDDEIIVQTLDVSAASGRPASIVTFDTGMAFQARQVGVAVHKLPDSERADG